MEYCVNCKHLEPVTLVCLSPKTPRNLVTGLPEKWSASNCRGMCITGCGEDAKWFEFNHDDLDDLSTIPFGR